MAGNNIWEEVIPVIEKLKKEYRDENRNEESEVSMRKMNEYKKQILDIIISKYEECDYEESIMSKINEFRNKHLQAAIKTIKQSEKDPIENYIEKLEDFKALIFKGFLEEEECSYLVDSVLDLLRGIKMSNQKLSINQEVINLKKENAVLQQSMAFLKEEIGFLKSQKLFHDRTINLQKIVLSPSSESKNDKTPIHGNKIQFPSQINQITEDIEHISDKKKLKSKILKGSDIKSSLGSKSKNESDLINMHKSRKDSLTTTKTEGNFDLLGCFSVNNTELLKENREQKETIERLKFEMKELKEKSDDNTQEKDHLISMIHLENKHTIESLTKQLDEIKGSHKQEKEALIKRFEDEAERSKGRMRDLDCSWIQRAHIITTESDQKYDEMVSSLKSIIDSKSREFNCLLDKVKDIEDNKRMDTLRYESRIQDLKGEIRKQEAKVELLKKKLRDFNTIDHFSPKRRESTVGNKMNTLIEVAKDQTKLLRDSFIPTKDNHLKTDSSEYKYIRIVNSPNTMRRSSEYQDNSPPGSGMKLESKRFSYANMKESYDVNDNDAHNVSPSNKLMRFRTENNVSSKKSLNNIVMDMSEDFNPSRSRIGQRRGSRENLIHTDLSKYFQDTMNSIHSSKNSRVMYGSGYGLDNSNGQLIDNRNSSVWKRYNSSAGISGIAKPLDYFLRKKESLNMKI